MLYWISVYYESLNESHTDSMCEEFQMGTVTIGLFKSRQSYAAQG
jgi:hypothetical protein